MSGLIFSPLNVGKMTIKNRFMRSPVWESMSDPVTGVASQQLLNTILNLAKGGVGLIIPGYTYVTKSGQALPRQTGMYDAKTADVWKSTIKEVHSYGSKLMFQICHGGCDCIPEITGAELRGASDRPNSRAMTLAEIEETIEAFINSAKMAERAGADGVELHGAGKYLLSEFMSPALNHRTDKYGGSFENRLRIVKEISEAIRKTTNLTIGIKMNGHDVVEGGVTPELAAREVQALDNIDFFEISCGLGDQAVSIRSIVRGTVFNGLTQPEVERVTTTIRAQKPGFEFKQSYNAEYAEIIKKRNPNKIIATVGGNRELSVMKDIIETGKADIVSLARPFIREPGLVNAFMKGKTRADCLSCGECIWRPQPESGVRCTFPKE